MSDSGPIARCGVRIARSIREVDATAWNRIAGENPLVGHGWLAVLERELCEAVERRYVLVERAGLPLAAAACYVDAGRTGAESVDDLLFGRLAGRIPGQLISVRPALVCGLPWSLSSGCLFDPALSEPDCAALADRLVDAISAEADRRGWTPVFLGVAGSEHLLMARLRADGYLGVSHEPLYLMEVEWPDFETYRKSLPSQNIRKNIRREQNRNRKQGVRIHALVDPAGEAGQLHAIADRHYRRYGWPGFPFGPDWFRAIKAELGDDAVVNVAYQDDRPVGVAVSLRRQGTRQLVLVCVDHEGGDRDLTHFNLAYYRALEDCIRAGDRRYVVGPGQHVSRSRRGYRRQASYLWCRPRGVVRRRLLDLWLRLLSAWLRRKEPVPAD